MEDALYLFSSGFVSASPLFEFAPQTKYKDLLQTI